MPTPNVVGGGSGGGGGGGGDVEVDGVTLQNVGDVLSIKSGGVGGTQIAAAIKDPDAAVAGLRTLGTGAAQAMAGNDSRVSAASASAAGIVELATQAEVNTGTDAGRVVTPETLTSATTVVHPARTLTAGAGLSGGGDLSSDRSFAVNVDDSTVEINSDALRVKAAGITDSHVAAANKDGAAGTACMRTLGTSAGTAAAGNDARFDTDNIRIIDFDFAEDPSNTQIQRKKVPNGWTASSIVGRATGVPTAGTIAVERDNDNTTQTQFTGATVNATTISQANTETSMGTMNATAGNKQMGATSWIKVTVTNLDLPASTDALNLAVLLVRT